MKQTKALLIVLLVLILMGAAFWTGRQSVKKETTTEIKQLQGIVDQFYPAPGKTTSISGTIKGIVGAAISLETTDPNDYLPHADGSARRLQTRTANVLSNTEYSLVDYSKFDKDGNPTVKKISLADLKIGDRITVRSNADIKDAQRFDAIAVEKTVN